MKIYLNGSCYNNGLGDEVFFGLPPWSAILASPDLVANLNTSFISQMRLVDDVKEWADTNLGPFTCATETVHLESFSTRRVRQMTAYLIKFANIIDLAAFQLRWA